MMRVITGTARGKRLRELPGLDTRPTTDRVKEGLFNIIQFDVEGRRVLDLFAGTGQLGIEALSRRSLPLRLCGPGPGSGQSGAGEPALLRSGEAGPPVYQRDFLDFLKGTQEKYDLVFLDPPYASGDLERALEYIAEIDIVSRNGIIICESPADRRLPALAAPYEKGRDYRYGKIKLTLYRRSV